MHELPVEWKRGSWTYTQVWREGDLAIYRQKHQEGPAVRFEVIRVQHQQQRRLPNGGVLEAGEYYPNSARWGQDGFTVYTLDEARALAATLRAEAAGSASA
jgi:hypothetical protein